MRIDVKDYWLIHDSFLAPATLSVRILIFAEPHLESQKTSFLGSLQIQPMVWLTHLKDDLDEVLMVSS
jgi:hypothetical protein